MSSGWAGGRRDTVSSGQRAQRAQWEKTVFIWAGDTQRPTKKHSWHQGWQSSGPGPSHGEPGPWILCWTQPLFLTTDPGKGQAKTERGNQNTKLNKIQTLEDVREGAAQELEAGAGRPRHSITERHPLWCHLLGAHPRRSSPRVRTQRAQQAEPHAPFSPLRAAGLLVLTGAPRTVFLARVLSPPCPLLISHPRLQGPQPCPLWATLRRLAAFPQQQTRRPTSQSSRR